MAYSNDFQEIRGGLVNYIGSMLKASKYEGKVAKQNVASVLIEEALKLSQGDKNVLDLYINKPLLKATKMLFEQRISVLQKLGNAQEIKEQIAKYQIIIDTLDRIINSVKD